MECLSTEDELGLLTLAANIERITAATLFFCLQDNPSILVKRLF